MSKEILTKIKVFFLFLWSDILDTYKRIKIPVLAILALIVAFEFKKLQEFLLVYMGQRQIKSDQKQDQKLTIQESQENKKADDLIKKAKNEPNPGDDWYKDSK